MEMQLRAALLDWLRSDPLLGNSLNAVAEEAPVTASIPWLGVAASASVDWGTKDRRGREVRIALELHFRGDDPVTGSDLVAAIERRIETLPSDQSGLDVASVRLLRARAEQRTGNIRAMLLEYRFRILEA
jgi:hypothetical protein